MGNKIGTFTVIYLNSQFYKIYILLRDLIVISFYI